jgi:hypothetical protein
VKRAYVIDGGPTAAPQPAPAEPPAEARADPAR